jgi:hypothetical protein
VGGCGGWLFGHARQNNPRASLSQHRVRASEALLPDRAVMATQSSMFTLINPVERAEPFDHPDWLV